MSGIQVLVDLQSLVPSFARVDYRSKKIDAVLLNSRNGILSVIRNEALYVYHRLDEGNS